MTSVSELFGGRLEVECLELPKHLRVRVATSHGKSNWDQRCCLSLFIFMAPQGDFQNASTLEIYIKRSLLFIRATCFMMFHVVSSVDVRFFGSTSVRCGLRCLFGGVCLLGVRGSATSTWIRRPTWNGFRCSGYRVLRVFRVCSDRCCCRKCWVRKDGLHVKTGKGKDRNHCTQQ